MRLTLTPKIAAIAATLLVLGALLFAGHLQRDRDLHAQHLAVMEQLGILRANLETALNKEAEDVRAMAFVYATKPDITAADLTAVANRLTGKDQVFMGFIVSQENNIDQRFIAPEYIHEADNFLSHIPAQWHSTDSLRYAGHTLTSGPYHLSSGQTAIALRHPVYFDQMPAPTRSGIASVNGVISLTRILDISGLSEAEHHLTMALRDAATPKSLLYGKPDTFNPSAVSLSLSVPGGNWEIAAEPRNGWGSLPTWTTLVTAALVLLLAGSTAYATVAHYSRLSDANRQLSLHHRALDSSANALVITDNKGTVVWANPAYSELTGYPLAQLIGRRCGELVRSGQHDETFYRHLWKTISAGNVWHGELINRHKSGRLYHDETTITPIRGEHDEIEGYVTIKRDVSMRKIAEAQVEQLAYFDALTGLPNRRLLLDRLSHALSASKRSECYGALMFLDLDNFKPLNDNHGHDVGDLLLMQVAQRITHCLREEDTVARFGGDEFIVLLSQLDPDINTSEEHARIVGEKILEALSAPCKLQSLRETDELTHIEHSCTASIGVRLFRGNEHSPEALLREADQAMYRSKLQGRGCLSIHLP